MNRSIAIVIGVVAIGTSVAVAQSAQTRRVLTTADYDRAVKMLAPSLNGLVVNDTVNAPTVATRHRGSSNLYGRRKPSAALQASGVFLVTNFFHIQMKNSERRPSVYGRYSDERVWHPMRQSG